MTSFIENYLQESVQIIQAINPLNIQNIINELTLVRTNKGRVFMVGVGGSFHTAEHMALDLRKLCKVDALSFSNVGELTARVNDSDDGWLTCFAKWLEVSNFSSKDLLFVFSVGGGDKIKNVSANLVNAMEYVKSANGKIVGIVGRNGGETKQMADACVLIPALFSDRITPHSEGLASELAHLIISSPELQTESTKWESVK